MASSYKEYGDVVRTGLGEVKTTSSFVRGLLEVADDPQCAAIGGSAGC
jgi:hypothetical protein